MQALSRTLATEPQISTQGRQHHAAAHFYKRTAIARIAISSYGHRHLAVRTYEHVGCRCAVQRAATCKHIAVEHDVGRLPPIYAHRIATAVHIAGECLQLSRRIYQIGLGCRSRSVPVGIVPVRTIYRGALAVGIGIGIGAGTTCKSAGYGAVPCGSLHGL